MQAQLSNVLEAKLIADGSVDSEKFNETVLRCTEAILDVITSTTDFGGAEELVVHSLQSGFVEDGVLGPHDQGAKGVEGQDDGILLHLTVENSDLSAVVGKFLGVDLERQAAASDIVTITEQNCKHVGINVLTLHDVIVQESIEIGGVRLEKVLLLLAEARVSSLHTELRVGSELDSLKLRLLDQFINIGEFLDLADLQGELRHVVCKELDKSLILLRLKSLGELLVLLSRCLLLLFVIFHDLVFLIFALFTFLLFFIDFVAEHGFDYLNNSSQSLIARVRSSLGHHSIQDLVTLAFGNGYALFCDLMLLLFLVEHFLGLLLVDLNITGFNAKLLVISFKFGVVFAGILTIGVHIWLISIFGEIKLARGKLVEY